jgi:putative flippase GtrA
MAVKDELLRFGVVGVASNLALFGFYMLLTVAGTDPKLAMTLAYMVGAMQTYFGNRRFTFGHVEEVGTGAWARYLAAYLGCYLLNWGVLFMAVDVLAYHHYWVQGVMVPVVAALMFLLQRQWVFRPDQITVLPKS